jgi:hypothetical protein
VISFGMKKALKREQNNEVAFNNDHTLKIIQKATFSLPRAFCLRTWKTFKVQK